MNPRPAKVGILPLYLKLYDDNRPEMRNGFDAFMKSIETAFLDRGIQVATAPICRIQSEFGSAVNKLEENEVDLLVTVHLAYSPSLESIDALAGTSLPLLILDTTMDACFDQTTQPDRILYNHGIHGVQDLANLLLRRKKAFQIIAGHVGDETLMERAADIARSALAARRLRTARTLRIGPAFQGMGDFSVDETVLQSTLGISVDQIAASDLEEHVNAISVEEVQAAVDADNKRFDVTASEEAHRRSCRLGLGMLRCLEQGGYDGFSMNFGSFDQTEGAICTTPFWGCSMAMERGIGYGGEGDILTGALVGGLLAGFPETTFTEIFCPDWEGNSIFLSHMGEINPRVIEGTPRLCEQAQTFSPTHPAAYISGAPREGAAVYVNLAPGPDDTFTLLLCPVMMLPDTQVDAMRNSVRGWMRSALGTAAFLEDYSRHGGTHHSALVLGEKVEALRAFAAYAGIPSVVIG